MKRQRAAVGVVRFVWPMVMVLALSAAAGATGARPALRLFDLTTAHGIVDRKPDRPATIFTPGDNPIYVWFRAEGCAVGTTITSVWSYIDNDVPVRLNEGAVTVEVVDDWGQFNFEQPRGKRWPIGEYRVELRVRGETLAFATFRIAEDTSPRRSNMRMK